MSQEAIVLINKKNKSFNLVRGLTLTLVLTLLARQLTSLPFFSVMGTMVIAILLGISWRAVLGVPRIANEGIDFAAKRLLKLGVILMGIRLDINMIIASGPRIILIDALVIVFTIALFWWLGKRFSLNKRLAALLGVGTAVCGAAAIAAVAPLVHADDNETAISVGIVALLGTLGALVYTLLQPFLPLSPYAYGVLTGSTLHEVAHVVAASMAGGKISSEIAILVKLGRVALLIPVAMVMGYLFNKKQRGSSQQHPRQLPIPWFVFGFFGFSLINTFNLLTPAMEQFILQVSIFLLTMAMAGLGLHVRLQTFRRVGGSSLLVGVIGSLALALFGWGLLILFSIT
ncbi:YeiH family protein [Carboxydothermus pertinax]|uniref:Membrane protein n=1 Tax=Carboxydothermus pertinax TaxID=870242 RepID=A0A1L8CTB2_9THEO|nr:putative sulfate exporter family transporter [Carboxydothermus pertinax]GAV22084.1 membrane protein [Carboxydothermus pertinax]